MQLTAQQPGRTAFGVASWVGAAIAVIGFGRSFYFRGFTERPPLTGLLWLHGVVMSAWVALFVAQTLLVARQQVRWHRRLGLAGTLVAAAVVVVGYGISVEMVRSGHQTIDFLIVPLSDLAIFVVFVGLGILWRRKPQLHKRAMLLSCAAFLPPALARFPGGWFEDTSAEATDVLVCLVIAFDAWRTRRLHPVFLGGAIFIAALHYGRVPLDDTAGWLAIAKWLTG